MAIQVQTYVLAQVPKSTGGVKYESYDAGRERPDIIYVQQQISKDLGGGHFAKEIDVAFGAKGAFNGT